MPTGTFTRPDGSRSGLNRPTLARALEFPYDRDTSYGEPNAYDRGSSGAGPSHSGITPKDTSHSIWDEDMDEASGTPISIDKANRGQIGNSTGVPGAAGGWASDPARPWDEDDKEALLDLYGEQDLVVMKTIEIIPSFNDVDVISPDSVWDMAAGLVQKIDAEGGELQNASTIEDEDSQVKKLDITHVREIVGQVVAEAKRKPKSKKAKKVEAKPVHPSGYQSDPAHDLSVPLGDLNVYKMQGASNIGPYTGTMSSDERYVPSVDHKVAISENSIWDRLLPEDVKSQSHWDIALKLEGKK